MAEYRRTSAESVGSRRIAFGDYQFDCVAGQLWRGTEEITLPPRASALLVALAERSMQVVTKKELIDRLWDGRAVGDDALTSCVLELRRALGDDARNPRFVETRHRLGYRLLLPVVPGAMESSATEEALPFSLPNQASVAVLPFDNISGHPDQAYFADGLAEDLITGLSRVSWLFVVARNSSFSFRGKQLDARTIGERLGVRYLVEGSVRRAGQRLRLTAQLIEAATGNHLWAERYDGSLEEVFDFQDRIIISLVGTLEPKLRGAEIAHSRRKQPGSLDAYDLFLQALPKLTTHAAPGLAEAIELLDRAIDLSPDYAQALAYAAMCRALRPVLGCSPDTDKDFREATELCRRALLSDPANPDALRAMGNTIVLAQRDYQAGWVLVDQALAVDPNSARTWNTRGWISAWAGETEMAVGEFEKAMRLSPFDPQWGSTFQHGIAFALCTSGRPEEALPWARKSVRGNPDSSGHQRPLIAALWLSGRHAEAREAARRYVEKFPGFSIHQWLETSPYRRTPGQQQFFDALRAAGLPE